MIGEADVKDVQEMTGISVVAIQKLLDQLQAKKYVERGDKDGSWRVYVTHCELIN